MVFGDQDASGVINLHHLVVLITTTDSDCKRVLIDNLRGPINDLRKLATWRHELRKKVSERGLGRRIEFSDHLPSHLPEERQVSFEVLTPNIVNERANTLVKVINPDQFKLG